MTLFALPLKFFVVTAGDFAWVPANSLQCKFRMSCSQIIKANENLIA
jgi:hypothetical protein